MTDITAKYLLHFEGQGERIDEKKQCQRGTAVSSKKKKGGFKFYHHCRSCQSEGI